MIGVNQNNSDWMTKVEGEFNYKKFVLHFESAFTKVDIGKEFQIFLKSEFNEDSWIFLNEIKKLSETKNFILKTIEIIENHLLETSKNEINISGKVKFPILKHYEIQKNNLDVWKFESPPDILFEEISKIIKDELYHDPWKRFIRTKIIEKIIFKYQNDSTVCSPQVTEKFNYTDEYFEHPYIFQQDFKFAEELFHDNFDWEVRNLSEKSILIF